MRHCNSTSTALMIVVLLVSAFVQVCLAQDIAESEWKQESVSADGQWAVWRNTERNQVLEKFKVVNVQSGKVRRLFSLPYGPIALSPDGSILATGDDYEKDRDTTLNRIKLWDTRNGKLLKSWSGIPGHFDRHSMRNNYNAALAFTPDGKKLINVVYGAQVETGFKNGHVATYDVQAGSREKAHIWWLRDKIFDDFALTSITLSPSGNIVAVETSKGGLYLFEAQTGRPLHTLQAWSNRVNSAERPPVVFSADGTTVETAENDEVKVWSVQTGELLRSIKQNKGKTTR